MHITVWLNSRTSAAHVQGSRYNSDRLIQSDIKFCRVRRRTAGLDLKECFGERFTVLALMRGALVGGGVLLNDSLSGTAPPMKPETAGSTATAPGKAAGIFFLFEGGMRDEGKEVGMGSFSIARYTRCNAFRDRIQTHNYSAYGFIKSMHLLFSWH